MSISRITTAIFAAGAMLVLLAITVITSTNPALPLSSVHAGPAPLTVFASQDAWVDNSSPTTNHGTDRTLQVGQLASTAPFPQQILVQFDLSNLPSGAIIISATLELYATQSQGGPFAISTEAIQKSWSEATVTWDTKPASASQGDPLTNVDANAGYKAWDVTNIAKYWANGNPNFGILLLGTSSPRSFYSREFIDPSNPPKLTITYDLPTPTSTSTITPTNTPTDTPTPTNTPTNTPTATPTPIPTANLVADKIEVTQAVQDLNNSVRLVKNKRTFVRFHTHSNSGLYWTYATLRVQRGANVTWLYPINGFWGYITVRPFPDRGVLNHSFLFELPAGYKEGSISLTAYVNPLIWPWRLIHSPLETNYGDNDVSTSVSFETVPQVHLVLYRVGYRIGGTTYYPTAVDTSHLTDWLRRAYPLNNLWVMSRSYYFGTSLPSCGQVNSILYSKKIWDLVFGWLTGTTTPAGSHYYGMVSDGGGFMRGCAMGIPAFVASGPTGPGTWGWDTDGSYGDWYGGHELGHTYGRGHANFCGAAGGPSYPYPGGRISPSLSGNSALYGFDISTRAIYGPSWKDVMSYCNNEWMSDFTYEGIMSFFQSHSVLANTTPGLQAAVDRLLVSGHIDLSLNQIELDTFFIIPNADEVKVRDTTGTYAIVLFDAANKELARYPFKPDEADGGMTAGMVSNESRTATFLIISEMVPYVEGTVRVDIEGPGGTVLKSVSAGAASPTVKITSPNGGEVLDAQTIKVAWTASDPDGDLLHFNVQYSPDNGQTWEMLAQDITEKSIELDANNVVSGDKALFRVWASDGIHTASDTSDASFSVPNHLPTVEIVSPDQPTTVLVSQTLNLEGHAYDPDTGTMDESQLTWTSDLQGLLGNGEQLSVPMVVTGTHTISFQADDGHGGVVSDTVQVTVLGDPSEVSPISDTLTAGPERIVFDRTTGDISATISIDNLNGTTPISWTAQADETWIHLDKQSGVAPEDSLNVTFDDTGLAPGQYVGNITLTQSALGLAAANSVTIQVTANVEAQSPANAIYLPLIIR